ncbi:MAG: 3D-(3,5/4)-trihydroxycyclohexane-1,2-dione acylhydrolase (decyclizing), partial [Bacteriovoracales bacterium]
TVIIFNNNGYKSIGSLSRSLGSKGFGTRYAFPQDGIIPDDETLNVSPVEVDYALNAKSLGAQVWSCKSYDEFKTAIMESRLSKMTNVIIIENDRFDSVPGYHTWWDVPVAEVSTLESVQKSRKNYEEKLKDERYFFQGQ